MAHKKQRYGCYKRFMTRKLSMKPGVTENQICFQNILPNLSKEARSITSLHNF